MKTKKVGLKLTSKARKRAAVQTARASLLFLELDLKAAPAAAQLRALNVAVRALSARDIGDGPLRVRLSRGAR